MGFSFRPAARENVALLVGLAGSSGSGKTFTAMRLAKGIAGTHPFAVIDTEAGRANHYADQFRFDHGDLTPPFTPDRYAEAIAAADAAKYPVIVVDSMSHEHAGEGGLLDWHDAELARMAGDDFRKREACNMAAWIKPKTAHKRMTQHLLQVRAHIVLCFRAEPKIEMVKVEGKWQIVEKKSLTGRDGWVPVSEKTLPYELTASFLLMADRPGVPLPIKLQQQHRDLFPLDVPITEAAGERLAAWAKGSSVAVTADDRDVTWSARIATAPTLAALYDLVNELGTIKDTLPVTMRDRLRHDVTARRAALGKKPKAAPAISADDIQWTTGKEG
jgi:hypothetical protein